jgi:hypothetical protein
MLNKIESVEEFIARGGAITKCKARLSHSQAKWTSRKQIVEEAKMEEVDWNLIPEHIKIRLGTRSGQKAE